MLLNNRLVFKAEVELKPPYICVCCAFQTCMGKDVTLHVSASNPAMLLYQKFGFKAEEYILDFYDKYYPVDSPECRHAFFLRLRR